MSDFEKVTMSLRFITDCLRFSTEGRKAAGLLLRILLDREK